jgi:hypothetical protein
VYTFGVKMQCIVQNAVYCTKYSVLYKIYYKYRYTYLSVLSMQFHHIETTDIFSAARVAENMYVGGRYITKLHS